MKLLRVWLVVLLAVVLPVKGAMAAAMLCPPGHVRAGADAMVDGASRGHGEHAHTGGVHEHHAQAPAQHEDGKGMHDKCGFCSSSCSSPSMPSPAMAVHEPEVLASPSFPDLCAPAPTFLSDGQERPPRTP